MLYFAEKVEQRRHSQFKNLMFSWAHAVISCIVGAYITNRDLIQHINKPSDWMTIGQSTPEIDLRAAQQAGISTVAYFLYDSVDYYRNLGGPRKNMDMVFHHGLVFALFIPAIMNWAILQLISE